MNESIVVLNSSLTQTVVLPSLNGFKFNIPRLFNNVTKIDLISLQIGSIASYTTSADKLIYMNIDQIGQNSFDCCSGGTFVVPITTVGTSLVYYENEQYYQSVNLLRNQNMSSFTVNFFKDNMEPLLLNTENMVAMLRLHYDATL